MSRATRECLTQLVAVVSSKHFVGSVLCFSAAKGKRQHEFFFSHESYNESSPPPFATVNSTCSHSVRHRLSLPGTILFRSHETIGTRHNLYIIESLSHGLCQHGKSLERLMPEILSNYLDSVKRTCKVGVSEFVFGTTYQDAHIYNYRYASGNRPLVEGVRLGV